jgi:hypothetical protein
MGRHNYDKRPCRQEAYLLSLSRHPTVFLYLGLSRLFTSDLSHIVPELTMDGMPSALELHAREQILQSRADVEQKKSEHTPVTRERIDGIIPTLREEQQHILSEYFDHLTPEQEKDALDRLNDLASVAEKTFAPMLRTFQGTPSDEQIQQFEVQFFNWMALVMPSVGEKSIWLQSVEDQTGIHNINQGERIWTSQRVGRYLTNEQVIKDPALKRDIEGWQETTGLLIHTAAAAWGIERFVKIIQDNLLQMKDNGTQLNERQQNVLSLDRKTMHIWLLFHDALRTFSHDPFVHAAALPLFGKLINLPEEYLKDFDLPEIIGFMHPEPEIVNKTGNMPEGLEPFAITEEMRQDPTRLMELSNYYIERVLKLLQEMNIDDGKKEAILIFWLMDAYSKIHPLTQLTSSTQLTADHESNYAFPSEAAVNVELFQMLARAQKEEEEQNIFPSEKYQRVQLEVEKIRAVLIGLYQNPHFLFDSRGPQDTNHFLMGRFLNRTNLAKAGESIVEALTGEVHVETAEEKRLREENERLLRYYSRQNDMAFAVFDWIRQTLDIDKQDIWKFFIELGEINYRLLDGQNKFFYGWNSAETSPLGWKTDRSATVPKIHPRQPLYHTLSKSVRQLTQPTPMPSTDTAVSET